jgi:hypothetical protein
MGQPSASSLIKINDFKRDLTYSLAGDADEFWSMAYERYFPNMVRMEKCEDKALQLKGVDRKIYLSNGNVLAIDEKLRRSPYKDVALEYVSNSQTGSPGWIEKDLAIDFIAYGFAPTREVYLFSFPLLRRCWLHFKSTWMASAKMGRNGFSIVTAKNETYCTYSVAVPIEKLQRALTTSAAISLTFTVVAQTSQEAKAA